MAAHLTSFYLHVVADVISNVRQDFLGEGIDEAVLLELQSLWELNLMQRGAIQSCRSELSYLRSTGHPFAPSVHDLNMPYAGETPTAELLFPPTPAHTPGPSFLASGTGVDTINPADIAIGRPAPYMPSPWANQKPDINLGMTPTLDMNVAYEGEDEEESSNGHFLVTKEFLPPTGKRKREVNFPSGDYVPQQDGAGDSISLTVSPEQPSCGDEVPGGVHTGSPTASDLERTTSKDCCKHIEEINNAAEDSLRTSIHSLVPQLDGIDDNYDDGVAEEDYNEVGVEADSVELKPTKSDGGESDGEPPLNEDDDLDGTIEGEDRCQTQHVVYAQFEKVTRAKNKWKCILKDGIMHLNGSDLLFSRAMGEFEF